MNRAFVAIRIADALEGSDVLYLADDEQEAEALAETLRALLPDRLVFHIPSSDTLPGEAAPASPANSGRRVAALRGLRLAQANDERNHFACILSGEAAGRQYAPPTDFDKAPPVLRVNDAIDIQGFAQTLEELGYLSDDRVDEPGESAIRGEVIDIYPADAGTPARIELAQGHIAAIRSYDPITQRTDADLDHLEVGRASEPVVQQGVPILAHVPQAVLAMSPKADERRLRFIRLAQDAARFASTKVDAIENESWREAVEGMPLLKIGDPSSPLPRFSESRSPLAALDRFVRPLIAQGHSLFLAGSQRDLRFLRPRIGKRLDLEFPEVADWDRLKAVSPGKTASIPMPVDAGFVSDSTVLIAAADVLGSRAWLQDVSGTRGDNATIGGRGEVRVGDVVVHEDHGVGRVMGLQNAPSIDPNSSPAEMIVLEYAAGARRLVPVGEADRIWRYGADADAVTLDKLDGSSWVKRRSMIDAAVRESAKGLAALAEARASLTAPVLDPDAADYEKFTGGFAFNETADQARAISSVRDDLASGRPMDRIVIGDVGYGKTEVALRAAALSALAGYQVIVAAPTTVLVRQHFDTFKERFATSGIEVATLSRLSTAAEKKKVKAGLADGSVHIVIGTGAVMAKGVTYNRLGLVVIDEEQRFGAADKTKLRGPGDVHLLSLSATPIPRTLQAALVGLQQMSIIATPPARLQPIRTSITPFDDARLRTALSREKARGGQSFVVVPRIEDMAPLAEKLKRLVPDLELVQAHGKLPVAEIDAVMVRFAQGEGDILLATNIIEAGLDVPRANTMIVHRADRFGLAQLHQLRGRVGRGSRRGQVILLTEDEESIAPRTLKRLRTLATFDRLGAGFDISAHDLDMRGAGDLLGDDQAGHMKLIGVDLYQHMLGIALRDARGENIERWTPDLNIGAEGTIPPAWIPDDEVRLDLYIRLSRIEEHGELDEFEDELQDRFGALPPEAQLMMAQARIRLDAHTLGIARIDAGQAAIAFTPRSGSELDAKAAGLVTKEKRFILSEKIADDQRTARVQDILRKLGA